MFTLHLWKLQQYLEIFFLIKFFSFQKSIFFYKGKKTSFNNFTMLLQYSSFVLKFKIRMYYSIFSSLGLHRTGRFPETNRGSISSVLLNMLITALCKLTNRTDILFRFAHMCILIELLFRGNNRKAYHVRYSLFE